VVTRSLWVREILGSIPGERLNFLADLPPIDQQLVYTRYISHLLHQKALWESGLIRQLKALVLRGMGSSPIEVTIFFCFLCFLLLSSAWLRFLAASFCSDRINILLGQREPSYSGLLFEIPITLLSRGPRFESEWFLLFAALGYHQPCLIAISIYHNSLSPISYCPQEQKQKALERGIEPRSPA
jgi:hypothetical protein